MSRFLLIVGLIIVLPLSCFADRYRTTTRYGTGAKNVSSGKGYRTGSSSFARSGSRSFYKVGTHKVSGVRFNALRTRDANKFAYAGVSGSKRMMIQRFRITGSRKLFSTF